MFVRTVRDAKAIQAHIRNCFERASMPGLTGEESKSIVENIPLIARRKLLTLYLVI